MLNIEHFEKLSLDGVWRFQLLNRPTDQIRKRWAKIAVPGLWTSEFEYERRTDENGEVIADFPTGFIAPETPDQNPTGVYETDFEIPGSWENKRVVLHLGGIESVALVIVNGDEVGIAKDSRLASEFEITPFLKGGKNVLRILVSKWTDASYIEDLDSQWHGGISRSVKLYATSDVYLERVETVAVLAKDRRSGFISINSFIGTSAGRSREGFTLRASIEELPKVKSAAASTTVTGDEAAAAGNLTLQLRLPKVAPWSAEQPNLYTLQLELVDPSGTIVQISSQKVGFRTVTERDGQLVLNGKPLTLQGINRLKLSNSVGRTFTRDEIRQILLEFKRQHINAIYTSHFTHDPVLIDLADELGFYLIAEPNINIIKGSEFVANHPAYLAAFIDRASRLIQRDLHHPSVIAWSLGDHLVKGVNFETAAAYILEKDLHRPLLDWDEFSIEDLFQAPLAPVTILKSKSANNKFTITNNNLFTDLSPYEISWTLFKNEIEVMGGRMAMPNIQPGKSAVVALKLPTSQQLGKGKKSISIAVHRIHSSAWASAGSDVVRTEFSLPNK